MRIFLLLLFLLSMSCGNRVSKKVENTSVASSADTTTIAVIEEVLPALEAGDIRLKDNDFGEEVSLSGQTIETDDIFAISEVCALCKDSTLLLKTLQQSGAPFRIYSLPTMRLDTTVGRFGRGPGEYNLPEIYPYAGSEYLAMIIDHTKESNNLHGITRNGNIKTFATRIPEAYFKYSYTRDFAAQDRQHIVFSFQSKIYHYVDVDASRPSDSLVRPLVDLRFGKSRAGSTRYIGSLGVNFRHNRIVWAYKYDKQLLVADFEGNVRRIRFTPATNAVNEGTSMDTNVTHYWKLYTGEKYFYVYYSGRTPMEVMTEKQRGNHYAFIEQFDWNGNPVRRYRIDKWGYFTVDEPHKRLYVISTSDEYPFVKFELPE